jgi:hypothetical protein
MERFIEIADEDDLRLALARLQLDCNRLRDSNNPTIAPATTTTTSTTTNPSSSSSSHPRWFTPHDSGYESDSSFTTASTSMPEMIMNANSANGNYNHHTSGLLLLSAINNNNHGIDHKNDSTTTDNNNNNVNAGLRLLRGSAQARVLLETRLAISRAATFCQAFADPTEPGSHRRRAELLRAFRALTELSKT